MSAFYQRVIPEIVPPKHMKRVYFDAARREYVYAAWPFNYAVELAWRMNCWWCHYTRRESWLDRLAWEKAERELTKCQAQVAATARQCRQLHEELSFAQRERAILQDQRDFCMSEVERLRKEAERKDKLLAEMRAAIRWVTEDHPALTGGRSE